MGKPWPRCTRGWSNPWSSNTPARHPYACRFIRVCSNNRRQRLVLIPCLCTSEHRLISNLALREAVARLYNETYRKGKSSQYTYENVCIVPGGRSGLSRVAAVVGDVYCVSDVSKTTPCSRTNAWLQSYQVPDYTAYDQVLSAFKRLVPVPTVYGHFALRSWIVCSRFIFSLESKSKYRLDIEQTKKDINTLGLSVLIASNPRNPTGQVIKGNDLKELVSLSREGSTLILDEVNILGLCCWVLILIAQLVLFMVHLSRQRKRLRQIDFVCRIHRRRQQRECTRVELNSTVPC